jgi:hypothetical protein
VRLKAVQIMQRYQPDVVRTDEQSVNSLIGDPHDAALPFPVEVVKSFAKSQKRIADRHVAI